MIESNHSSKSRIESRARELSNIRPGSQKGRILSRLRDDYPNWTPAYKLRDPDGCGEILQQNARVWELKHLHGVSIENKEEFVGGVCHSSYRLKIVEGRVELSTVIAAGSLSESLFPLHLSQPWHDPEEAGHR